MGNKNENDNVKDALLFAKNMMSEITKISDINNQLLELKARIIKIETRQNIIWGALTIVGGVLGWIFKTLIDYIIKNNWS